MAFFTNNRLTLITYMKPTIQFCSWVSKRKIFNYFFFFSFINKSSYFSNYNS